MDQMLTTLGVIVMFIFRIGIPVAVLIGIGIVIDRWQSHREQLGDKEYRKTA